MGRRPNPNNPPCPKCGGHTVVQHRRDNGLVTYRCKQCQINHTPGGTVGRPKREDEQTPQQAWNKANRERLNEAQRERRRKKKEEN